MSETSIRYLRMLEHIPRQPQKKSVGELQELLRTDGFEVDRRSVQRDLNKLSNAFGITEDGASPAGSYWLRGAKGMELPAMTPPTRSRTTLYWSAAASRFATPRAPRPIRQAATT